MAAPASAEPIERVPAAKTDAERLRGVWLFEAAAQGKKNQLGMVWTSKLTVAGDTFQFPNFLRSKKNLTGKFTLDPAVNPNAIDVQLDEFDLSSLGVSLKLPAAAMPGIFKLEDDRLTVCFNAETAGKRPPRFDMTDDFPCSRATSTSVCGRSVRLSAPWYATS